MDASYISAFAYCLHAYGNLSDDKSALFSVSEERISSQLLGGEGACGKISSCQVRLLLLAFEISSTNDDIPTWEKVEKWVSFDILIKTRSTWHVFTSG